MNLLEYALWYAELGYAVFPCAPGAKQPLTSKGLHDATTDALEMGFAEAFDDSPPEKLNQSRNLISVSAELDPATERINLSDNYGVPLNAIQCFCEGEGSTSSPP